jgi:hypothetical protein
MDVIRTPRERENLGNLASSLCDFWANSSSFSYITTVLESCFMGGWFTKRKNILDLLHQTIISFDKY